MAVVMWESIGTFIYDFQTLIAGFIAIGAAFIAALPVWRQLERINIQTNMILRDFLTNRIQTIGRSRKSLADRLGNFEMEIFRGIHEMAGSDGGRLDVHWAFDQDQTAGILIDDLRRHRNDYNNPAAVESDLDILISRLQDLRNCLDAIHRTHSMDQSDEDHSISDEGWAEMQKAGLRAEQNLSGVLSTFSDAVKRLLESMSHEIGTLQERVRGTDQTLLQTRK